MPSAIRIRRAAPQEAESLTALANRSKAHWPYDADYLAQVNAVRHVKDADIVNWPHLVAERDGGICGFAAVAEVKGERMLDHLWIEPEFIGRGVGRILFLEAVQAARGLGWSGFTIASDPYAEEFYLKMGAKRIGQRESKIKKGFFLPLLEYGFEVAAYRSSR